jgi:2-polyprenyl-3-methyl-5-hydroxy-6-metoxy-1,4-benzoquinol methylase
MGCDHPGYTEFKKYGDVSLYKCHVCGDVFTDLEWNGINPKELYKDFYKNEMAARFGLGIECLIRAFRFFRAFKVFTAFPGAKMILDIGSGRGFMLYYLKKYYHYKRTAGTQISENAYVFSRDVLGLEIYDKDLLDLSFDKGSFDVITIWHVLEHISKPDKYIERIYEILNDHGKLIVEVPNFDSWSLPISGKYWLGLDLDHHIHFFTPESLSRLLENNHFRIKTVHTFSLEYSTFISAQSLASRITKTDQLFFRGIQEAGFKKMINLHSFLLLLLIPVCLLVNLCLYFSKKGEVLFILAEKDK